ncbi:MAG: tRNA 2-thiouridine(34) synthase MnmA [Firmicutes bacterium]|nr:tRNA 2-thiouridine(34) synthase MnmA [Bacillota bacterium]
MTGKVLVAMSGGVDSSVAALILKQTGYSLIGATMKLFSDEIIVDSEKTKDTKTCCSLDDTLYARSVAARLDFPYYVFNYKDDFQREVIERFVRAYENGLTPNPCIECNSHLKFDRLLQRALELGCDYIATGHYARVEESDGRYILKKAADENKDQSYVLYLLTQEQLSKCRFPLGNMRKDEIRKIAAENGFVNANKPDSQDICFIPDGDFVEFIKKYRNTDYPEGDFLDTKGNVIGRHQGAIKYTIGQRKGLGMGFGKPMYVCGKCMKDNTVTLSSNEELFKKELRAGSLNWIAVEDLKEPMKVTAKIRYSHKGASATVYPEGESVRVVFDEPQRAITPGQAAVFYDGDIVVGGGTIL